MPQPGIAVTDIVQDHNGSVAILDIGAREHEPDEVTERVGYDVALAVLDFLARIEALGFPWSWHSEFP